MGRRRRKPRQVVLEDASVGNADDYGIVLKFIHQSSGDIKRFRLQPDEIDFEHVQGLVLSGFGLGLDHCEFESASGVSHALNMSTIFEFALLAMEQAPIATRVRVYATPRSGQPLVSASGDTATACCAKDARPENVTGASRSSQHTDANSCVPGDKRSGQDTRIRSMDEGRNQGGRSSKVAQYESLGAALAAPGVESQARSTGSAEADADGSSRSGAHDPQIVSGAQKIDGSARRPSIGTINPVAAEDCRQMPFQNVVNATQLYDGMRVLVQSTLTGRLLQLHHDGSVDFDGTFEHLATFSVHAQASRPMETVVCLRSISTPRYLRCFDARIDGHGAGPVDPNCHISLVDVLQGIVLFLGPPGTGHVCAQPGASAPIVTLAARPQGFRLFVPTVGGLQRPPGTSIPDTDGQANLNSDSSGSGCSRPLVPT